MIKYLRIEDMHPKIRAFFERAGKLKLDDEETPEMVFLTPNGDIHGHSIAISAAELKWLEDEPRVYAKLWENCPPDKWLYWGVDKWVTEEEMLKIIKLKAFI
jgi:hypothetical protein